MYVKHLTNGWRRKPNTNMPMRSAKFGTQGPASPSHSTVYIQTVKDHDRSARHGETKRKIAHMRIAHLRDAVDAIARKYGLQLTDCCWPTLLSKKQGAARLALCPSVGKPGHESVDSAAHKVPPGWDLDEIGQQHSRRATSDELKFCNFSLPSNTPAHCAGPS